MKAFFKPVILILLLCTTLQSLAQSQVYEPIRKTDPKSWSMVLLPDPQSYMKFTRNQGVFDLMTTWVSENIDSLNIQMVLCTGDLVEQNNLLNPNVKAGNQSSSAQWKSVAQAFSRLDGRVPYISATGNHDYGFVSAENRDTFYDQYFPVDKNILSQKLLKEVGTNAKGDPSLVNASYEMVSPYGQKLLFLVLEFAPRNETLVWAEKVINLPKYKDHQVILLTHSYLNAKNQHIEKEGYPLVDANYGAAVFNKLVKPSKNIRMVFSGHIGEPNSARGHIGFKTDVNAAGKNVQQMVFNAQAMGGGWHGNGGDGWLRILEFMPDGKTVKVKTFSPLFAISPATQHLANRKADYDEFTFTID
jgi:hypothetical protein